jgi:hypothetical protein
VCQIEAVARAAREEAHLVAHLAAVRLEVQRQLAVGFAYARLPACDGGNAEANGTGEQQREKDLSGHDDLPSRKVTSDDRLVFRC